MPNLVYGLIEIAKNDIMTNNVDGHPNVETQCIVKMQYPLKNIFFFYSVLEFSIYEITFS